jgi:hypothetical protein
MKYSRKFVSLGFKIFLVETIFVGVAVGKECELLISGGSLAALTSALSAAREGVKTCLVEPTNWAGGQLTASAVPAIDFAWHTIAKKSMSILTRQPENKEENLRQWTTNLHNPGGCWVSHHCFSPKEFLEKKINPAIKSEPNLKVFFNTVVKSSVQEDGKITGVTLISRPLEAVNQKTGPLSETISSWYKWPNLELNSQKIELIGENSPSIFIDASENGDLLALSSDAFSTGADDEGINADSTCGQATVFPFVISATASNADPVVKAPNPDFYSLGNFTWDKVWTYRRLKGSGSSFQIGEKSLQNWNPGNDYPFGYLWQSATDTILSRLDWMGGYNLETIKEAEIHSLGWYSWYKENALQERKKHISLEREWLGTTSGLSKYPYVRDTRRSIGLDGFRLTPKHLIGNGVLGEKFFDRVAIHTYAIDIHPLAGKSCYKEPANSLPPPYYIPFRALTNRDVKNLLVAGKTMAQTFLANASTRVHPGEMASGTAAGMAASFMIKNKIQDTSQVMNKIPALRTYSAKRTPSDWTGL